METAEIEGIRSEIETALTDAYGNTITLRSAGTITYDEWGEPVKASQVDTSAVGVNDNYLIARMNLTQFGRLKEGESIVIVKYSEPVDETYTIVMNSVEYNVMSIENLKAADVVVAKVITVATK